MTTTLRPPDLAHHDQITPLGLGDLLANRRWIRREKPFTHVLAYDVFRPDVYARLETAFRELLAETNGHPYMANHGIHGQTISRAMVPLLHPLLTREWHDILARAVGLSAPTGHVAAGIHHHVTGSKHGFPHNDLNPGFFVGKPASNEIDISGPDIEYTTGVLRNPERIDRVETIRAAAMLFYLANPTWKRGDGGGTGIYRSARQRIDRPTAVVPPLNNSMLLFECTPASYHGFISNASNPRNSIVMWLHRDKSEVVSRWGAEAIVPYGKSEQKRVAR